MFRLRDRTDQIPRSGSCLFIGRSLGVRMMISELRPMLAVSHQRRDGVWRARNERGRQLRRPYLSNVSAVSRKIWRMPPALSATSSRHSGLSLSLAMVSRQSMPLRPHPKPPHHPANRRARRLNESLGGFGMCNGSCENYTILARKCRHDTGHFQTGHCNIQIRPPGVKTGQYPGV